MKCVQLLLVVLVSLAAGSVASLFLEARIGFADTVLACAIGYGATIIGALIILGILITRNYIRERKTHRIISRRLGLCPGTD